MVKPPDREGLFANRERGYTGRGDSERRKEHSMRHVVVTEFLSLDGVMEEPAWTFKYWNDEIAQAMPCSWAV